MRHLKRTLTDDPGGAVDIAMRSASPETPRRGGREVELAMPTPMPSGHTLPLPGDIDVECAPSQSPPLQPPPWKRPSLAAPGTPPRKLTPRISGSVSWSEIVSQSQGSSSPRCPGTPEPRRDASSPRTPCSRAVEPPSPPSRFACRRRPPSDADDEEFVCGQGDNEGRLARDFCELTSIGKGQFSTVFRVRNKIDRCLYAVKKTTRISRGLNDALREVFALATVGIEAEACRNIVRYFSSWLEDGRLHIQTELCVCSLRDRMAQRLKTHGSEPRFTQEGLVEVLREVSSGLAVLHSRNFVHLDIKPDNILVSGGPRGCYKIADLGLAAAAIGSGCDDISEGDCRYLAKEVLRGDLSGLPKADVFSLGLVVYELATNPKPLPCNGDEWHLLRTGQLDVSLLPTIPETLLELLLRMVLPESGDRPSCEELCKHPSVMVVEDELQVLQDEMRRRTLEAERSKELADGYWAELLTLKRQELSGVLPAPSVGGRPVASPAATMASDDLRLPPRPGIRRSKTT